MAKRAGQAGGRSLGILVAVVLLTILSSRPGAATSLAGLKLAASGGPAGTSVKVTGTWFASVADGFAEVAPVRIWWGGPSQRLLRVVEPDEGGTFITHVTIPHDAGTGPGVLVATQTVTRQDGQRYAAPGTPARAEFVVGAEVPAPPPTRTAPAPPASAASLPVIVAGSGAAGLALGLLGLALLRRDLRRASASGRSRGQRSSAGAANAPAATVHTGENPHPPARQGGAR